MICFTALLIGLCAVTELDPATHAGSLTDELRNPARITALADGGLLVTDLTRDHIVRFSSAGALIGTWSIPEGPIAVGHADDFDGPLFRPLRHNGKQRFPRPHLDPDAIDRIVKKYASTLGLNRGYSAHSMRATFITTALENGCSLEDVQRAAAHADPSTTKLYDRRGYNPEKSASFFANY